MEWLQTYKIGKALLDSGKYQPINAYLESYKQATYKLPKNKESKQEWAEKTPYILDIIADLRPNATQKVLLDYCELDDSVNTIKKDNFFTSVAGNFTSYYLATPYSSVESIADFLGINIEDKKIIPDVQNNKKGKDKVVSLEFDFDTNIDVQQDKKNKDKAVGVKSIYEGLIKSKLLETGFNKSLLIELRDLLRQSDVVETLAMVINNLPKLVEANKRKVLKEEELLFISKLPVLPSLFNLGKSDKDDIAYVRLKVLTELNPDGIYLNQLPEYRDFGFMRFYSLGNIDYTKAKKGICYFSGQEELIFNVDMPRDSVNLLKVNSGSVASSSHYKGSNFVVSKNAYDALKLGAWFITKHLTCKIATVPHYIIPDFRNNINVEKFTSLKAEIDLAFKYSTYKDQTEHTIKKRIGSDTVNSISFIGHHIEAGKAIDILNRIQLVEPNWFEKVFDTFEKEKDKVYDLLSKDWLNNFSLPSVYGIMPVFTDKAKLNNTLFFFKNLLEQVPIEANFLLDNYKNLIRLLRFSKVDKKSNYAGSINIRHFQTDTFDKYDAIGQATIKYQILFNLLNTLFNTNYQTMENTHDNATATFFANSNYNNAQKALFYLGRLIRRVANAQKNQGSSKAILDKITYDGMNVDDIIWLSIEVAEKLKQYDKKYQTLDFGSNDFTAFQNYFNIAKTNWNLSTVENVFYLFSGYAMYWATTAKEANGKGDDTPEPEDEIVFDIED